MSGQGTTGTGAPEDIAAGERFAFGENWQHFLSVLDEGRIERATAALAALLETDDLSGRRFLDAGSGSGLSSLAAVRLGARVVSFDFDPASVACTQEVRRRHAPTSDWEVMSGDVLDRDFVAGLGQFDVVYSWGVLHHTGSMWEACDVVSGAVSPGGLLHLALYNDQGMASAAWTLVKRRYNRAGPLGKRGLETGTRAYFASRRSVGAVARRLAGAPPLETLVDRGMDAAVDLRDWVGGYPFEVASPEEVFDFYRSRGFVLRRMKTVAGHLGCNEFVFERARSSADPQR
jgi:2-polyprenyl-6-hydroxyphenyl methylase/3-demethylubiquinone-9 3-methyltransferase